MSGLYPLSRIQQFDRNGRLLDGALLRLFDGGTSTPRIGYADGSLSTPLPWPIPADAYGRLPLIYLDGGYYRHRLVTKEGTVVFDDDGIPVFSTGGGGSGSTVDPNALFKTRDIKIRFDNAAIDGYVRLNGRTIGSAGSGATERANSDTQSLFEELWGYFNITVIGGRGASPSADFAADKQIVLPNAAGRGIFGMDDLGAGPQNVISDSLVANSTEVGSHGGNQTISIGQANIPAYTLTGGTGSVAATGAADIAGAHQHTGTGSTGGMNRNSSHSHTVSGGTLGGTADTSMQTASNTPVAALPASININTTNTDHEHSVSVLTSVEGNHFHTVSVAGTASNVQIASGGSGTALPHVPPLIMLMIYIRL